MSGQKGFITTEFLFAIVIAFGMSMLTFAMTFTLSTVEVAQYIVYSAARAQAAGNLDKQSQIDEARLKYDSLATDKKLSSLFSNGWFSISKKSELEVKPGSGGATANFGNDYQKGGYDTFQGVRTTFIAKILELNVPFLGKVTPDDGGFKTRILALMIREPSHQECVEFMKERVVQFGSNPSFDSRFGPFLSKSKDPPIPWEDNGC